jgi:hypothetical protein
MDAFLCQDIAQTCPLEESWGQLAHLLAPPVPAEVPQIPAASHGAPLAVWPSAEAVA